MSLPKYSQVNSIGTVIEIDQEIFVLQKELFDLRIKQAKKEIVKGHLFIHNKRRIAQLKFKKVSLLKLDNVK
jgi:ribosomal protein L29